MTKRNRWNQRLGALGTALAAQGLEYDMIQAEAWTSTVEVERKGEGAWRARFTWTTIYGNNRATCYGAGFAGQGVFVPSAAGESVSRFELTGTRSFAGKLAKEIARLVNAARQGEEAG